MAARSARTKRRKDKGAGTPVVLITGAAQRLGAAIARRLHADGWSVLLHARSSAAAAQALADTLNAMRADSAAVLRADLRSATQIARLAQAAARRWRRLDALVHNASSYFPTPLARLEPRQVDELLASNLRAPLLLTRSCLPHLAERAGIVHLLDAQVRRPVAGYAPYLAAKAGLWTLTEALALELAPKIRVNGVAPGHMLWPQDGPPAPAARRRELAAIPLRRLGGAQAIADAVAFLLSPQAEYLTGTVIRVDGGKAI